MHSQDLENVLFAHQQILQSCCDLLSGKYKYRISLISSLGLLFFLLYWDGEATIQGGLLNEVGIHSSLLSYSVKFSNRIIFAFLWIGLGHKSVFYQIPRRPVRYIIDLIKVNFQDT